MPIYNKLVRDRIPEIIEMSGKTCTTRLLTEEEYIIEINKKMYEEIDEYDATETSDDAIEELADLLELIHAPWHITVHHLRIWKKSESKKQRSAADLTSRFF